MCLNPIKLKDRLGKVMEVPCGKCIECKKERSKEWAFRLMCESLNFQNSIFITLTYDDENVLNVPGAPYPYYATLSSLDLQLFFKRLRFNLNGRKIKYYACGEYGSNTFRPHYHAIIFNMDFCDSPLIEQSWGKGFVQVDPVNVQTINYVAGYVQKKLYGTDSYPDMIQAPFSRMSKRLGFDYFERNAEKIWNQGITFQGFRLKTPRYFYRLMEQGKIGDKTLNEIYIKRQEDAAKSVLADDLELARRFGYLGESDEKGQYRLIQARANREAAAAREKLKNYRSKI